MTYNTKKTSTLIGVFQRPVGETTITINVLQQINAALQSDGILSLRLYRPSGADTRLILHSKESNSEAFYPALEISATPLPSTASGITGPSTQSQEGKNYSIILNPSKVKSQMHQ